MGLVPDQLTRHWHDDEQPKPRKRGFEIQERRGARAHPGGKLTRGSGCSQRPGRKSDSVGDLFRQECKTTEKAGARSIRIERKWLGKIEAEATATGLKPMLVFGFSADPPEHQSRDDWAAFPLPVAHMMTEAMAALLDGEPEKARTLAGLALGRP